MNHAKLSPSSAARRMACPGSRELETKYPMGGDSQASREGHAAHWVASELLACRYDLPLCAPNGEPITKEMLEGGDLYVETINWVCKDSSLLHIEERVDISNVHQDCWGTPDCWTVVDNHLHVFDYKFGHGYVEPYENWQLLEYAAGIMQKVSFSKVTLTIVQPRNYSMTGPVRHWTITMPDLLGYIQRLQKAETAAMTPNAFCIPSPQCRNCSARYACTALQEAALSAVDTSRVNMPWDLTPLQTGNELRYLRHASELLEARMTGLEEQAKSMITRGEFVAGFNLESSAGRERWNRDIQEVLILGEMLGIDLSKPADAITPAQARKLGLDESVLKEYSQRTPGALKLIEDKNAITSAQARKLGLDESVLKEYSQRTPGALKLI